MFRKLKLAVAVSLALMPVGVWALGLGSIHTKSGLNQNFSAEIDLVSVNPDELDTIKVQLAGPEDFARLGMDRPYHLTKLRFRPDVSASGQPILRVSSSDALREPYLNFLVEIVWPKGRMVREYTVLLDPPSTAKRQAFTPGPRGVRATSAPPPERLIAREAEAVAEGPGVEYGPTKTGDTLWSLSRQMVPGASPHQTMMALFRHNPDAFAHGDINLLKTGKILRLPGQQVTSDLPSRATAAASRRQSGPLESGALPGTEPGSAQAMREDELKLVTARPESGQPGVTAAPPPSPSQAVGRQLQNDLLLAREETAIARKESDELRNRVEDLEGQLTKMQRLMTLQNDHLAQLQAAAKEVTEAKEKPPEPTTPPKASPTPSPTPVSLAEPTKEPSVPVKPEGQPPIAAPVGTPPPSVVQTPLPASPSPVIPTPAAETPAPTPAPVVAPAESPKPPVSTRMEPSPQPSAASKASKKADESGWLTLLKENTLLISLAGAGMVLLGALAVLLKRRRIQEEEEFPESILVSPVEEEIARDMARSASSSVTMTGFSEPTSMQTIQLTSQLSDFGDTDIDTDTQVIPDTGQFDPIAEADVYIAYGRYDQAAELIRQAVSANPDRQDYKVKLAECYAGSGNKTAFQGLARELSAAGLAKTDPSGWKRLTNLARDAGIDLGGLQAGGPTMPPPPRASTEGIATAAVSAVTAPPPPKAPPPHVQPEEELLDLDFDFADLMTGIGNKPSPRTQPPAVEMEDDLASLDFELPEIPTQRPVVTPAKPPQKTLEEELGELDIFDLSFTEEPQPPTSKKESELSLDGFVDYPHITDDKVPELQFEEHELSLEGYELTTEDEYTEVDTKLELAQAYIEMGDPEDAKSILQEVLTEGNEGQIRRARQMLASLS